MELAGRNKGGPMSICGNRCGPKRRDCQIHHRILAQPRRSDTAGQTWSVPCQCHRQIQCKKNGTKAAAFPARGVGYA